MTRSPPPTANELEFLRENYPDIRTKNIAMLLGWSVRRVYHHAHKMGLRKSEEIIEWEHRINAERSRRDPRCRAAGFQKGQVPHNKGLRRPGYARGRMAETQFKSGEMRGAAAHNYVPIGTDRITRDGSLERKITDDPAIYPARRWVPVARLVWEAENGPIPRRHVVRFKDGQHTVVADDITLDRLECISCVENMRRNTLHRYPKLVVDVIRLRGVLTRKIRNREKQA